VTTLVAAGLLERDGETRRYRLTEILTQAER
jgi:DNA-binding IclR family transcriptional regulator